MLRDRCPVCPVSDVGVLWINGWMDQDETWHAIALNRDPAAPKRDTAPQFSAQVCCGPTAGWIKM